MAKHGELFESKILIYVQPPITGTQTRIHRTQSLHYDKLLKRSSLRHIVTMNFAASLQRYIVVIYRSALRDIVATKSR